MLQKKIEASTMVLTTALIFIFTFSVIQSKQENIVVETNSRVTLSNKKIGWGIRRNSDHEQPDVGNTNKQIIEKYDGICLGNKEKKYIYLTFDNGYEARIYRKNIGSTKTKPSTRNILFNCTLY